MDYGTGKDSIKKKKNDDEMGDDNNTVSPSSLPRRIIPAVPRYDAELLNASASSNVSSTESSRLLSSKGLGLSTVVKIKHTLHRRLEYQRKHRLLLDPGPPLPYSAQEEGEEPPTVDSDTQFKYIKGNKCRFFRQWVQEGVEGFETKKYTILLLVLLAM